MKLSYEERLKQITAADGGKQLDGETISTFYKGVSLLAKQPYPEWLQQQLRAIYEAPADYPVLLMLQHARNLMNELADWDWESGEAPPEDCDTGVELMSHLLIEPFYLIHLNETTKEESNHE